MDLEERILRSHLLTRMRRYLGKRSGIHLNLKRFTPSASEPLRVAMNMQQMSVDCVIDVGANKGQFGESLYDFGYQDKIISFEPVESAYQVLEKRARRHQNWIVASRCAIGSRDGKVQINVSDDSVFSSILEMSPHYVSANPKSRVLWIEEVPIYSLDSIMGTFLSGDEHLLLKIDTEGYEKEVLEGASDLLHNILGLKIEIPLQHIYENPKYNFYEIIELVRDLGFMPYSFNIEGVDLQTGRVNTIDGLFFRVPNAGG
jgi:FkbM family methyltransferase